MSPGWTTVPPAGTASFLMETHWSVGGGGSGRHWKCRLYSTAFGEQILPDAGHPLWVFGETPELAATLHDQRGVVRCGWLQPDRNEIERQGLGIDSQVDAYLVDRIAIHLHRIGRDRVRGVVVAKRCAACSDDPVLGAMPAPRPADEERKLAEEGVPSLTDAEDGLVGLGDLRHLARGRAPLVEAAGVVGDEDQVESAEVRAEHHA